jgi:hypothetical protein
MTTPNAIHRPAGTSSGQLLPSPPPPPPPPSDSFHSGIQPLLSNSSPHVAEATTATTVIHQQTAATNVKLRRRGHTICTENGNCTGNDESEELYRIDCSGGGDDVGEAGGGGGGGGRQFMATTAVASGADIGGASAAGLTSPDINGATAEQPRKKRHRGRSLRSTVLLRPRRVSIKSQPSPQHIAGLGINSDGTITAGTIISIVPPSTALLSSSASIPASGGRVGDGAPYPSSSISDEYNSDDYDYDYDDEYYDDDDDDDYDDDGGGDGDAGNDNAGAGAGVGNEAMRFPYPPLRSRSGSLIVVMAGGRTRQEEMASAHDTIYWGWVVLLTTWVVFVIGMGSVGGVWEWAWGVNVNVSLLSLQCCFISLSNM